MTPEDYARVKRMIPTDPGVRRLLLNMVLEAETEAAGWTQGITVGRDVGRSSVVVYSESPCLILSVPLARQLASRIVEKCDELERDGAG